MPQATAGEPLGRRKSRGVGETGEQPGEVAEAAEGVGLASARTPTRPSVVEVRAGALQAASTCSSPACPSLDEPAVCSPDDGGYAKSETMRRRFPQIGRSLDSTEPVPDRRLPAFVQGLPLTAAALTYADALHAGQRRPVDGAPFILHPLEVASLLYYAGASDQVVAAGVLHDVIEDTSAAADDLRRRFGVRVTDPGARRQRGRPDRRPRRPQSRTPCPGGGLRFDDALLLFAADKISNVRALRAASVRNVRADVAGGFAEKIRHYRRSSELLEELEPGAGLVHVLREELELLDTELARASQLVG